MNRNLRLIDWTGTSDFVHSTCRWNVERNPTFGNRYVTVKKLFPVDIDNLSWKLDKTLNKAKRQWITNRKPIHWCYCSFGETDSKVRRLLKLSRFFAASYLMLDVASENNPSRMQVKGRNSSRSNSDVFWDIIARIKQKSRCYCLNWSHGCFVPYPAFHAD